MMLIVVFVCSLPGLMTAVSTTSTVFSLRYVNNNNKTFNMNFNFTLFSEFQRCLTDEAILSCKLQSSKVSFTTVTDGAIQTNITGIETIKSTQPTTWPARKSCTMSSYKLSVFEYYFSINCSISDDPCERELAIDSVRDEATSRCGFTCWSFSINILFVYSPNIMFFRCDLGPRFTLPVEPYDNSEVQVTSATVLNRTDSVASDVASSTTTTMSMSTLRPLTAASSTSAVQTTKSTSNVPTTTSTSIVLTTTSTSDVPTTTSTSTVQIMTSTSTVSTTTYIDDRPLPPPTATEAGKVETTKATMLLTTPKPTTTTTQTSTPPATTLKSSNATPPKTMTPQLNTTPKTAFSSLTSNTEQSPSTRLPTTLAASTTTQFQQFTTVLPSTTSATSNTDDDTKPPTNPMKYSTAETALLEYPATTFSISTSNKTHTSASFTATVIPYGDTQTTHQFSSSPYTASSTINPLAYQSTTMIVAMADSATSNNTIVITLSVIVSLLALATAAIFFYLFLQRRRQKRTLRDNESTRVLRADDSIDLKHMRTQHGEESHYSSVVEYEPPWGGHRGNVTPDLISSCEGSSSSDAAKKPAIPDSSTIPRTFDEYSRLHLPHIVKTTEPGATDTAPGMPAIYDNVRLQDLEPIYNLSSFSDDLNDGGNQTSTPKRDADTGRMLKFHDVNPYSVVILDPTLFNTSNPGTGHPESSSNKFIILNSVPNDHGRELITNSNKIEPKNAAPRTYVATKDYYDQSDIESDCLSVSATSSFNMYSGKNAVESPKEDKTWQARTPMPGMPLRFVFPSELL